MIVRDANWSDFSEISKIYAYHVLHGYASFEEDPPSVDELRDRWRLVVSRPLPFIVAEDGDQVVGYSYATPYRSRAAYRFTVEDSIYVADGMHGQGIGSALLCELIRRCESGSLRQMIAVIGDSGNDASIELHRKFGFRHAGTLRHVGYKFGRWVDSVLMQRELKSIQSA